MLRRCQLLDTPAASSSSEPPTLRSAMHVVEEGMRLNCSGGGAAFSLKRTHCSEANLAPVSFLQCPVFGDLGSCGALEDVCANEELANDKSFQDTCLPDCPPESPALLKAPEANERGSKVLLDNKTKQFLLNPTQSEEFTGGDPVLSVESKAPTCRGCRKIIESETSLRVHGVRDFAWHEECLRCCVCTTELKTSCFVRGERLYCREDYKRIVTTCSSCSTCIRTGEAAYAFPGNRLIFHVHCVACVCCGRFLKPGQRFVCLWPDKAEQTAENRVHVVCCSCRQDTPRERKRKEREEEEVTIATSAAQCFEAEASSTITSRSPGVSSDVTDGLMTPKSSCLPSPSKSDEDGAAVSDDERNSTNLTSSKDDQVESKKSRGVVDEMDDDGKGKKSKRPRTVLNPAQREKFKLMFQTHQKPTRKEREDLARETGLSPRVVQVWFQNQRAKIKKTNQQKDSGRHTGEEYGFHAFDPLHLHLHHQLTHLQRGDAPGMGGVYGCSALGQHQYVGQPDTSLPSQLPYAHYPAFHRAPQPFYDVSCCRDAPSDVMGTSPSDGTARHIGNMTGYSMQAVESEEQRIITQQHHSNALCLDASVDVTPANDVTIQLPHFPDAKSLDSVFSMQDVFRN